MSDFAGELAAFSAKTAQKLEAVFVGSGDEVFRSVVEGSEITGAPGQPVAPAGVPNAGKLRDSFTKERASPTEIVIASDVDYAVDVEYNLGGFVYHNHGPHSRDLTAAGFPRILDVVAARVSGP